MFHDDKLRRQLEEAYKQMNEPDQDKNDDNVEDTLEPTQSEEGDGGSGAVGGDGGAVGGDAGTTGDSGSETTTSNNDQRGLGGYGYYGMPMGRGWCKNGWKKDGSCRKTESYDNSIDSTQELYAIYEGLELIEARELEESGGTSARYAASDSMATSNDSEDNIVEGKKPKKKTQPHELGHSGEDRSGNKHMPPPSVRFGKEGKAKNRNDRRSRKQKGYDLDESAPDSRFTKSGDKQADEIMKSLRKQHPDWDSEKIKSVAYATVTKRNPEKRKDMDEADDKRKDDPCWKGYKQVGNKNKNGREVPNCVPVEEELKKARKELSRLASIINESHLNDEIRGVWDAFDQLADRIAHLEKAYEQEYEKQPHPQMGVAAETKKAHQNPEGGLNDAGRAAYKKQGHNLKRPVSKDQAKKSPKSAARRKSFCARMKGMKKKNTSSKTANDPDSRINKSLRKWDCN